MDGKKIIISALLAILLLLPAVSAFSLTFNDQAYLKSSDITVSDQYGVLLASNITNVSQVVTLDPADAIFITYQPAGMFDIGDNMDHPGLAYILYTVRWATNHKGETLSFIILGAIALYLVVRRK